MCLLLLVAAPCFAAAIAPVSITPLATPADGYAESIMMVNDRGEVAGGAWSGLYWSPALEMTHLPSFGEGLSVYRRPERARPDRRERMVEDPSSTPHYQLYLWSPADGLVSPGVLPGGEWIHVADMNNNGAIVGSSDDPSARPPSAAPASSGPSRAATRCCPCPRTGWRAMPGAINDNGWIVGDYGRGTDAYDVSYHGALWRPDGSFLEIGTPGESWSAATFVNNRGQVAGVFSMKGDGHVHPFIWSVAGGFVDCGQLVEGDFVEVTASTNWGTWSGLVRGWAMVLVAGDRGGAAGVARRRRLRRAQRDQQPRPGRRVELGAEPGAGTRGAPRVPLEPDDGDAGPGHPRRRDQRGERHQRPGPDRRVRGDRRGGGRLDDGPAGDLDHPRPGALCGAKATSSGG